MIPETWPGYLLDYERLNALAKARAGDYRQAAPFPHIVIDNFLPGHLVQDLLAVFPPADRRLQQRDNTSYEGDTPVQYNKIGIRDEAQMPALLRGLIWELNAIRFLQFLETLTGIGKLLPDPLLRGGGLHQTRPGGLLQIHADFNKHPIYGFDRRLNALIYLNPDWQDDWGGELELWPRDMSACAQRIKPIANRCVIFSTTSHSWHGHPTPVACPEGMTRKSIALYYYTIGRPAEEDQPAHKVLWNPPGSNEQT